MNQMAAPYDKNISMKNANEYKSDCQKIGKSCIFCKISYIFFFQLGPF
jgi:hypothetical protein